MPSGTNILEFLQDVERRALPSSGTIVHATIYPSLIYEGINYARGIVTFYTYEDATPWVRYVPHNYNAIAITIPAFARQNQREVQWLSPTEARKRQGKYHYFNLKSGSDTYLRHGMDTIDNVRLPSGARLITHQGPQHIQELSIQESIRRQDIFDKMYLLYYRQGDLEGLVEYVEVMATLMSLTDSEKCVLIEHAVKLLRRV